MKKALLEPLVGRNVRLENLKAKDLNGTVGMATDYDTTKQRLTVKLRNGNRVISVPLVNAVAEKEELTYSLLSRIKLSADFRRVLLGRTHLSGDLWSIFMERCLLETSRKTRHCDTCGAANSASITCAGCELCQWCSESCQRIGVEAGHGVLCQQYRALRQIYDNPVLKEAGKLFRSYTQQNVGFASAEGEGKRLAKNLPSKQAAIIVHLCHTSTQWPASSEIATCPPGSKVTHLSKSELDMLVLPGQDISRVVPGKLTLCASSHKRKYKGLSKAELNEKLELPCGKNSCEGHSYGLDKDLSHGPIFATKKDLSIRSNQQILCSRNCNHHSGTTAIPGLGKTILSDVFYSYCLDRVVNATDMPGSIQHCPMCGLCRNYVYSHMSCCNRCSYGSKLRAIPCMHCHDLVLSHDGVLLVPHKKNCTTDELATGVFAMMQCSCGNGKGIWNDGYRSKPRVSPATGQASAQKKKDAPSMDSTEFQLLSALGCENSWRKAQTDPLARVELMDKMFHQLSMGSGNSVDQCVKSSDVIPGCQDLEEMAEQQWKWTTTFRDRFEQEYKASNSQLDFESWLLEERDRAAASAKAEYQNLRSSGKPVDKARYKTVLADRCSSCGTKATPFKVMKWCSRCSEACYCDANCQRAHWPTHKRGCQKVGK